MIAIGITGGIGSGKTAVCKFFAENGIPIFSADESAKQIVETNKKVVEAIKKEFGEAIFSPEGKLERTKLASIVFGDSQQLEKLNSIVHPVVFAEFELWKSKIQPAIPYVAAEAALMFESGMNQLVDYVLCVTADEELRVQRIIYRDKFSKEQVLARMAQQFSQDFIKRESDFVIENNSDLLTLQRRVNFFHTLFSTLKTRVIEE